MSAIWWVGPNDEIAHSHHVLARVLERIGGTWALIGRMLERAPFRWAAAMIYRFVTRIRSHLPGTTPALSRPGAVVVEEEGPAELVVIGGGFGGLEVARRLRRSGVRITLVDRRNHHLFQPLLYQVSTAGLPGTSIAMPIRHVLPAKSCRVILAEVVDIRLPDRSVQLADGSELRYDYLVVAAGAKTSWVGREEWGRYALGMKDMRDAMTLRERLLLSFENAERTADETERRRSLTFVVVGGGPTGVELAGAMAELGRRALSSEYQSIEARDVRILLIEMGDRLLRSFHPTLSARAKRDLERLGVEVWLDARVVNVDDEGVTTESPRGRSIIRAATICWAPGVEPVELASRVDVARVRGRLVVDETCAIPRYPEVFCIGDLAHCTPAGFDEALPGLASVAKQQGAFVAKSIRREIRGGRRRPFRYRDRGTMATIGRNRAIVEAGPLRLSGVLAWMIWSLLHIFLLIGFRNRLLVFLDWAIQYVTWRRGARLIIGAEGMDGSQPSSRQSADGTETSMSPFAAEGVAIARSDRVKPEEDPQSGVGTPDAPC